MAAVVALIGVAAIHAIEAPDKFEEIPYQGVLFIALIAGALLAAALVARRGDAFGWLAALAVTALPAIFFVLSRTVGLPGGADDVGAWGEATGIASLVFELGGAAIALRALSSAPEDASAADVVRFPDRAAVFADRGRAAS
jgi:hypothetical protein